jgi:hypothetical protein
LPKSGKSNCVVGAPLMSHFTLKAIKAIGSDVYCEWSSNDNAVSQIEYSKSRGTVQKGRVVWIARVGRRVGICELDRWQYS